MLQTGLLRTCSQKKQDHNLGGAAEDPSSWCKCLWSVLQDLRGLPISGVTNQRGTGTNEDFKIASIQDLASVKRIKLVLELVLGLPWAVVVVPA